MEFLRKTLALAVVLAGVCVLAAGCGVSGLHRSTKPTVGRSGGAGLETLAASALRFEPNLGQADRRVRFVSRGDGYTLLMTRAGAILKLGRPAPHGNSLHRLSSTRAPEAAVGMRFLGANPRVRLAASGRVAGVSNYLIGRDPSRWTTGVPNYTSVVYRGLYPGIDLTYRPSHRGELEFDLTVAPSADPGRIRLSYSGTSGITVDRSGALVLHAHGGAIRQAPPVVYQTIGGARHEVRGRYIVLGPHEVGFQLDQYERHAALLIDPVITYSTYLGGSGDDAPIWSAIDGAGNFYATGATSSLDFPTAGHAFQQGFGGGDVDVFVTKLNPAGSGLVYSTYLGGGGSDFAVGLDVARDGSVVVTGGTNSPDYPVTPGVLQPRYNGGDLDTFVTKLDPTGSKLRFSTFLGGDNGEVGFISFFDRADNVLVEGETSSPNFPTTPHSFQPTYGGGEADGFVTKLKPDGSAAVWSTFIGGSSYDGAHDGVLDRATGSFYIDGPTASMDFPTTRGAFQRSFAGGDTDAWVAKLNPTGSGVYYSTYLGGSGSEDVNDLTIDRSGSAYIPGPTSSTDFPVTRHAFQTSYQGGADDGYVAKLDPRGSKLEFSTYLGGSGFDVAGSVRVDAYGNAYVPGITDSPDFPVTKDAFQPSYGGGGSDAFIAKLNQRGSRLRFSSFLGGNGDDGSAGAGAWLDGHGNLFVPGFTNSTNFPVTASAYQGTYGGGPEDVFLMKLDFACRGDEGRADPSGSGESCDGNNSNDTGLGVRRASARAVPQTRPSRGRWRDRESLGLTRVLR